ncbi:MAG: GTP-binding protein [Promethearchaeota archaeon]
MEHWAFKILLLGPSAVGKTSLLLRFVQNKFSEHYEYTMGVDYLSKELQFSPNDIARLTIWDIAGQSRFKFLRNTFYTGANGALIVFDLTRKETFMEIKEWLLEMRKYTGDIPFILIGNKSDLLEDVGVVIEDDIIKDFVKKENSIYIETSAKTGVNVDEAFMELTRHMAFRKDKIKFLDEEEEKSLPRNPIEAQGLLIKAFYEKYGKEALEIIRNICNKQGRALGLKIKEKISDNRLSTVANAFSESFKAIVEVISVSDEEFHVKGFKCPFGLENTSRELCEAVMEIDSEYFKTAVSNKIELIIRKSLAAGDSCCETIYILKRK